MDLPAWLGIARRFVALTLLFFVSPGVATGTADLVHFAVAGHTVDVDEAAPHEREHEDRDPCSTEHHCSGAFHICGCATSPVLVVALVEPVSAAPALTAPGVKSIFGERASSSRDVSEGQFKPPRL